MRRTNIYLIIVPEGEDGGNGAKAIFLKIVAMNVLELMKNMNPQIHVGQHIQSRITKKFYPEATEHYK